MAKSKITTEDGQEEVTAEQATPLSPSSITQAEDPGKNVIAGIRLNVGEVLLVSVDQNGTESGIPFKVNTNTYNRYYKDETKFRLKKTSLL
jgi:imidazole glycerol phosphate synthase subunit HisF